MQRNGVTIRAPKVGCLAVPKEIPSPKDVFQSGRACSKHVVYTILY